MDRGAHSTAIRRCRSCGTLRDELGLTGTKFGCGVALCGACTVHLNGEAIRSCSIAMSDAAGKSVVTIEGLDPKGEHPVQVAWRNLSVPQCGYCQTGQIMQAAALLAKTPAPTDKQIDDAMYWQHLPMRLLPAHPFGRSCRRKGDLT